MNRALLLASALAFGCEGLGFLSGKEEERAVLPGRSRRPSAVSRGTVEFEYLLEPTSACPHPSEIRDPAPLCESRLLPDGTRVQDVLWPLATVRRGRAATYYNLRPLAYVARAPGEMDVRVLPPIFRYKRSPTGVEFRLWPLFSVASVDRAARGIPMRGRSIFDLVPFGFHYQRYGKEGKHDVDCSIWPLVFWGSDREEGPHAALFPVGGVLKDFLGKKKISFVLFPLFMWTEDYRYRSYNFLWPLFAHWEGPDQWGFRAFPFAGANVREGRFERFWWLWPVFHYWWQGLDTKYPTKVTMAWPFWGRIRNANTDHVTVLWPFFSVRYARKRRLTEVHAPWPFFCYTKADGLRTMKVWPLFGYRNSNNYRSFFCLWPLYKSEAARMSGYLWRSRRACLLWTCWREEWMEVEKEGAFGGTSRERIVPELVRPEERIPDPRFRPSPPPAADGERKWRGFWKLWPLFHARREADGSVAFQFPSVWFTPRGDGEIETSWAPFVTLYRYERSGDHKRGSALFGFYRHVRDERSRAVSLVGVVSYQRRTYPGFGARDAAASAKRWSLLGGLFEYERIGRWKGLRLFWIRFKGIPRSVREDAAGL